MSKRKNSNGGETDTVDTVVTEEQPVATDGNGNGNGNQPAKEKIVMSRRDRFLRQVVRRVDNAIKRLKQVENLGNRSTYEATDDEYRKVLAAIEDAVEDVRKQFAGGKTRVKGFTL